jgi:hypothetical protein
MGGHGVFLQSHGLEVAGKKQVHAVARESVDRVLGGQIYPIEVVDAAVGFIGGKERGLDGVEGHGFGTRRV